jgi:uncharacterized membrane protein
MNKKEDVAGGVAPTRLTLAGRLRGYFLAGLLITAPISMTLYIAWAFIAFIDRLITPLIPDAWNPRQWGVPGAGVVLVVVALTVVGALTAGFVGRVWLRITETVIGKMPVLRGIYAAMKQIFETVLAQKSHAFREVALVEYPRRGIWTIAFITAHPVNEVQRHVNEELITVYVPTTPNPTSGFMLFLPRKDVRVLDMSVEAGLKLVLTTGIVGPPEEPEPAADIEQAAD